MIKTIRETIEEVISFEANEGRNFLTFREGECISKLIIDNNDVSYVLFQVEDIENELGSGKTDKKNAFVDLGYLKTKCLIIKVDKATNIEILTSKIKK